jgi:hypothetical protein
MKLGSRHLMPISSSSMTLNCPTALCWYAFILAVVPPGPNSSIGCQKAASCRWRPINRKLSTISVEPSKSQLPVLVLLSDMVIGMGRASDSTLALWGWYVGGISSLLYAIRRQQPESIQLFSWELTRWWIYAVMHSRIRLLIVFRAILLWRLSISFRSGNEPAVICQGRQSSL